VPSGVLLPPQTMADTRDLVNHLAGSARALSQAMIDPKAPPGSSESIEHQVRDLGAVALNSCDSGRAARADCVNEAPESTRRAEDDMPIRGSCLCGEVASEMSAPLYPPPRRRREA